MKTKILFITTLLLFIGCSEEVKQIVKSPTIVQDIEKNKNDRIESISFYKQYENDNKLELIKKIEYDYDYNDQVDYQISKYLKETEKNYKDGELNGLSTEWYKSGQKGTEKNYKDGELNGLSTEWYEDGQKETEKNYKDGELNRLSTEWYENGQKETEKNYLYGKKNGKHKGWFENGELLFEGTFEDGNETGMFTDYFKNGQIIRKIFWNKGIIDSVFSLSKDKENFLRMLVDENKEWFNGEYNVWYTDGDSLSISNTINYKMGSKHGEQTTFNRDGSVKSVENCINGECK